ncbi:sugar ABC transporter ATP-binding protein [Naasia sp. SYSU D00948]|uniref:sugar ABC transporter ATP-binding protein n=1 Tax=Naasia sp. SYSU D00948 TaxID=2817379 RepID=UPI001B312C0C|nr:sugar ABC transporter ATP-binding protein [Naasia sp. SYSU D00948]
MTVDEAPPGTPVLEMAGISKTFPGVKALDDAGLTVRPGEVHGLVGENGAGKSTIIKVLAGIYAPDSGTMRVDGEELAHVTPAAVRSRGIRFVHQELQLVPTFSVTESVFMGAELVGPLGVRRREMRTRAERILEEVLGTAIDGRRLIRDLGPAERKLVQIARALVQEGPRLVVFDEPTAPLAAAEGERVLSAIRRLRDQGIASLYVSHYLGEITEICDRATVFRNGTDVSVVDPIVESSGRELIRRMIGRDVDQLFPERKNRADRRDEGDGENGQDRDARGDGIALSARGLGDGATFADVSIDVARGEIVGLTGLLGSGTAEVVDTVVGLRRHRTGSIRIAGRDSGIASPADALEAGLVLIPRDRRHDGLVLEQSVETNLNLSTLGRASRLGLLSSKLLASRSDGLIQKLDIRPADRTATTRLLSGGNQQKVVLGRALAADAGILVLDDPTVGVDIGAKQEIYRLVAGLADEGAAVLIASNDPLEVLGLCDRIVVMVRGRVVLDVPASDLTQEELISHMTGSAAGDPTADARTAAPASAPASADTAIADRADGSAS